MKHHLILVFILLIFLIPGSAKAYIDPGTGGLIFQIGFAFFSLIIGWLLFPFRIIKEAWSRFKNRSKKSPETSYKEGRNEENFS